MGAGVTEFPSLLVSSDLFTHCGKLNGRRWSGQSLFQAWLTHLGDLPLHLSSNDPGFIRSLKPLLLQAGHSGELRIHGLVDPKPYAEIGGLFIPDPSIGSWARWRQSVGASCFSLIGQIHTLNTPAALGHLEALASETIHPWDAVICSSTAGRAVVESVFADREHQLQQRFGCHIPLPRPQLPVIPLPVPFDAMQEGLPGRVQAREALGIPAAAHVVVWLGRLSMLTKADPWPTYQILQRLALELSHPLWLIECGADDTPEQARHFQELRRLCPAVRFLRLGGAEPVDEATKFQALAAADLALSLVDNCQETFGLSVIEAMAAGLPVVATDWDGYRDSIRHGVDGFLVPCRWAPGSQSCSFPLGWQQQLKIMSFPLVSGALGQLVQLDAASAGSYLASLLHDPSMAKAMGQQGRKRAQQRFSGPVVMQQYAELFSDLAKLRQDGADRAPIQPPLSLDPVRLFGHFASHPSSMAWPEPQGHLLEPQVAHNRQALWHPLLDGLSAEQSGLLLNQLRRKHL